ncbi:MAG TPA: 4-vinyl reductase [Aggregatilineales bacterium]|nr:4-vinyl reductase [Aggregatilineales bacterium]
MSDSSGLFYPNRFARLFLLAMETVMGDASLNAILTMSGLGTFIESPPPDNMAREFDFASLATMSQNLEMMFGARGGRSMALRIGREMFSLGLNKFGAFAGMKDPAFIQLPLENRTAMGIQTLAAVFTNFSDQVSIVKTTPEAYLFEVAHSPMAWGRTAERPVCHAIAGILQEGLNWASNGQEYHVQEVICRASGGEACVFKINKNPIGGANRG